MIYLSYFILINCFEGAPIYRYIYKKTHLLRSVIYLNASLHLHDDIDQSIVPFDYTQAANTWLCNGHQGSHWNEL